MDVMNKWDELSREINYYYTKILYKDIVISFICNSVLFKMDVYLSESKKCNIPYYRAPHIGTYDTHDILYKEGEIIEDLVNKINGILYPKKEVINANPNAAPRFCPCCGAPRKPNLTKCPYCEIDFF